MAERHAKVERMGRQRNSTGTLGQTRGQPSVLTALQAPQSLLLLLCCLLRRAGSGDAAWQCGWNGTPTTSALGLRATTRNERPSHAISSGHQLEWNNHSTTPLLPYSPRAHL